MLDTGPLRSGLFDACRDCRGTGQVRVTAPWPSYPGQAGVLEQVRSSALVVCPRCGGSGEEP